jgi:lysozyme family protein
MKMERTECSETLAFKLQMLGNSPKENIQHLKNGESLKSNTYMCDESQNSWSPHFTFQTLKLDTATHTQKTQMLV